jgi:fructuronate reductase
MMRLSPRNLPAHARLPNYDRAGMKTGIVHLGVGAFHRAHQAVYTDACLQAGDNRWGILGASLRSPNVAAQLNPQGGLYSCWVRGPQVSQATIIGAIRGILVAPQNPAALVTAMASADVHIVTLTITEKGYKLNPATGALQLDDPDIAADLADLTSPRSAQGFLVAALAARRARGANAFTALSCDNLPNNGALLRQSVLDFAQAYDPALRDWIETHAAFPSSMVDRIVPATAPNDVRDFEREFGCRDEATVKTEPFSQWVIENRFAGARPDWETGGAVVTSDVAPWEVAKLRLLNGAHSALAYLGALSGYNHVHEAMADPVFEAYVRLLQDEAATTFVPPEDLDVAHYRHALVDRFKNPMLAHKTRQIAMDGSQKLPQRLLSSARVRLERGQSFAALALGIAGWIRWQSGADEAGQCFTVDDPLAAQTSALIGAGGSGPQLAAAFCRLQAVFGDDLSHSHTFVEAIGAALTQLFSIGARASVAALVQESLVP